MYCLLAQVTRDSEDGGSGDSEEVGVMGARGA